MSTAATDPMVVLRPEGLYCPAGEFYIDPWKPVACAVVTHCHGDHLASGSQRYLMNRDGLPIASIRLGANQPLAGVDYGERFKLGNVWLSLHPAGHIRGSAQVRLELANAVKPSNVWVISGDFKRGLDPTCDPFEVVPCDVFITEATFATPIYRWQPGPIVAREIAEWWQQCAAADETAVLFCYALGKAQRILAELARLPEVSAEPILVHGAMQALTEAYRSAGVAMLPTAYLGEQAAKQNLGGRLVLAPPSAYRSPWMRRFKRFQTGFASGWVRVRGALRQRGHDRGFVLSDHADWPELVQTVHDTGARRVLVTHGRTEILVRYLQERGVAAEALKTAFLGDAAED